MCQLLPGGGGGDFRHLPSELCGCRTKTNILLEISPGFPTKTTNRERIVTLMIMKLLTHIHTLVKHILYMPYPTYILGANPAGMYVRTSRNPRPTSQVKKSMILFPRHSSKPNKKILTEPGNKHAPQDKKKRALSNNLVT